MAAKLMAEDGIEDFAAAKAKAARLLGAPRSQWPDNAEVESALRAHQSLYQRDSQPNALRALREAALECMRAFARFDPHLVGHVLAGTAGAHSVIEIEFYCDSDKDVELDLINRGIRFSADVKRVHVGDRTISASRLRFEWKGAPIEATVLPSEAIRNTGSSRAPDGRALRLRADRVETLLAESASRVSSAP